MKGTLTAYILGFASCGAIWIFKDKIAAYTVALWDKIKAKLPGR